MRYPNILAEFDGHVWAITPEKLREIKSFVENLSSDKAVEMVREYKQSQKEAPTDEPDSGIQIKDGVAVVPIHGTISKRMNMLQHFSGGTSTEQLVSQIKGLRDNADVHSVVLSVSSPGGSVEGLSEAAEAIRSLRGVKNVVSVADDIMASAAYFLGSAANKVYVTPNATVGSIGTIAAIEDHSERLEKEGIKYNIIRSSPLKGAGHPAEPLSEEGVNDYQRIVDSHNLEFIRNVALNRNITMADAKKLADGRVHIGQNAVEEGFADGVATVDQIVQQLGAEATAEQKLEAVTANYEALVQQNAELLEQIAALSAEVASTQAAETNTRIDAAVNTLIVEQKKVAPMQEKQLRERLEADFEGTMASFALVAVGNAEPKELDLDSEPKETLTRAERIAQAEAEGKQVAYDAEGAKVFADFGIPYVLITE